MDSDQLFNWGIIGIIILFLVFAALKYMLGENVPTYVWFSILIYGGLIILLPAVFVWLLIPIIVILLLRYSSQLFTIFGNLTGKGGK